MILSTGAAQYLLCVDSMGDGLRGTFDACRTGANSDDCTCRCDTNGIASAKGCPGDRCSCARSTRCISPESMRISDTASIAQCSRSAVSTSPAIEAALRPARMNPSNAENSDSANSVTTCASAHTSDFRENNTRPDSTTSSYSRIHADVDVKPCLG